MKNRSGQFSTLLASLVLTWVPALSVRAQGPVTSVVLGPDQIGVVRTAPGISTRICFSEPVKEIICGDLYDPTGGKGSFVVQRGENDVFIKPIVPRGTSNLFVKTGEKGDRVYNFDLTIVAADQAYRVVNVTSPDRPKSDPRPDQEVGKPQTPKEPQQKPDDIMNAARTLAAKLVADAQEQAALVDKNSAKRAEREIERRFVNTVMLGMRETKIGVPRASSKNVTVTLDPRMLTFGDKSYLRFTINNTSDSEFTFSDIVIETAAGNTIPTEVVSVNQEHGATGSASDTTASPDGSAASGKPALAASKVAPGEQFVGIVFFDSKAVGPKDRINLSLRAADRSELARVSLVL